MKVSQKKQPKNQLRHVPWAGNQYRAHHEIDVEDDEEVVIVGTILTFVVGVWWGIVHVVDMFFNKLSWWMEPLTIIPLLAVVLPAIWIAEMYGKNPLKGDSKNLKKDVKEAEEIYKEAKEYAKSIGSESNDAYEDVVIVPTNYKAKINKLINYQTSNTKLKRTNLKSSKRFKGSPGLKKALELNDIIFGLDTSGSMSKRELGMAIDAIQKFRNKCSKLTVIQGDTKVTDVSKVKKNIKSLLVKGRGGTELTPILYKAKEYGFPKVPLVMFTDGEVYNFPDKNKLKNSLWVFTRESSARRFSKDRQGIPYAVML